MKTILAATDFSPVALNAAEYAAEMAVAINAKLILLHVYQLPVMFPELPLLITAAELRDNAEDEMRELKDKLHKTVNNKVEVYTEVRSGDFIYELEKVCKRLNPSYVVIGSQGTTATERLFFGGHVIKAMKHLKFPLITIPPNAKFSTIRKIALACDFENVVDTTPVGEIKLLLNEFQAELFILNTRPLKDFTGDAVFESGLLQEMLGDLECRYQFIVNKDPDKSIIDFAEKNHLDLLIVLPKRHDFFERLIHKSHSKQFVLHSHVPVLALHEL